MNNKKIAIGIAVFVIVILVWRPWNSLSHSYRTVKVQKGIFETSVSAMGELKAEKALDINVPAVSFNEEVDIWAMKIMSIIEEGKIVKKGEEVARLDPAEVEERLVEVNEKLNEYYTNVEDAKIDSSLTLAAARETIQKQKDQVLDAELKLQQSTYESKAVQRQSQIEFEKAERSLSKAQRDLITKTQRHKSRIARNQRRVDKYEYRKKLLEQLRDELVIKSPADGMIIYGIAYNGQKVKVGSRVGRWMPLIATLPDLNTIISELYVKEIDIAKITLGQKVKIKIDAFPKKVFDGEIISIANIGQKMPGEFQNGFKVIVQLTEHKESLLPGMTTSNTIIIKSFEDVLFVEKEAVYRNDSIAFVLKKDGLSIVRQEVEVAEENEEYYRLVNGLKEGDKVLLDYAETPEEKELIRL